MRLLSVWSETYRERRGPLFCSFSQDNLLRHEPNLSSLPPTTQSSLHRASFHFWTSHVPVGCIYIVCRPRAPSRPSAALRASISDRAPASACPCLGLESAKGTGVSIPASIQGEKWNVIQPPSLSEKLKIWWFLSPALVKLLLDIPQ